MLYDYDDTLKIILRIYEYLQLRVKPQPRTLKMYSQRHRNAVVAFMEKLPPSAGADFIWDFLVFQFYTYQSQDQILKPMPVWFMGDEAWRRWNQYDEGARWHAKQWASEKQLANPVKAKSYKPINEDALRKERYRMSRISGANYCGAKYGDSPYDPEDEICATCPFEKDCWVLYGSTNENGENLFQALQNVPVTDEERKHFKGVKIKNRVIVPKERNYGATSDNDM